MTLKLYYSIGACSLSPHIALREAGLDFTLEKVDLKTKQTGSGGDIRQENPKGMVPVLVLDSGEVLTEGPAIVQWIADQKPNSGLAPPCGTMARYHLMEWLNFVTSELHKNYSPLFNPKAPEEYKKLVHETLAARYAFVDEKLAGKSYLMGEQFTVADGYLFTVTNWARLVKFDLTPYPNVVAFQERVRHRPHVVEAMKAERIIK
ncbi:MAG TPA: glutathione transferase GstA [Stellaceae bacterium]|jgi:glutathione S-transferase|nr:glutathione transferase GstA [Stellaceae bacterium]